MTIIETLRQRLITCGLWPREADTVLEKVKADHPHMDGHWEKPMGVDSESYPPQLIAALHEASRQKAVEHLQEVKPEHIALVVLLMPQ